MKEDLPAGRQTRTPPYASDAWIDETVRDEKDNKIGIVGYEIPLTRYFYKYEAPRKVEEIEEDIKRTEQQIARLLRRNQ